MVEFADHSRVRLERAEEERAIQAATEEIVRRGRNPTLYRTELSRENDTVTVSFIGKDVPVGTSIRGSAGAFPGMWVALSLPSLSVVKFAFTR